MAGGKVTPATYRLTRRALAQINLVFNLRPMGSELAFIVFLTNYITAVHSSQENNRRKQKKEIIILIARRPQKYPASGYCQCQENSQAILGFY
jgi:hypothetical protein